MRSKTYMSKINLQSGIATGTGSWATEHHLRIVGSRGSLRAIHCTGLDHYRPLFSRDRSTTDRVIILAEMSGDFIGGAENAGPENAGPENAGPSRNAASLCCICMAKWTVTSSKGIGIILSWFLMNTLLLRTLVLVDA